MELLSRPLPDKGPVGATVPVAADSPGTRQRHLPQSTVQWEADWPQWPHRKG